MSRKYMNERWCVRCGKNIPTPFLVKCVKKMENIKGKIVVDIGCGNGRNSEYMKNLGAEVHSFDMCNDYGLKLNLGRDIFPNEMNEVDIILANYVLMFLDTDELANVINEINRIINRQNGMIVWELYPAKDSYYPDEQSIKKLNIFVKNVFKDFDKIYFTKDKGFLKVSDKVRKAHQKHISEKYFTNKVSYFSSGGSKYCK